MRPARWSTPDAVDSTIRSLPAVFAMMKAMRAEGVEYGEDYRDAARHVLADCSKIG
jgi:hypothetical protein